MTQDFSTSIVVDRAPAEVFAAINNVRGWWSEDVEGATDELGEFTYEVPDVHRCTVRVTQLIPEERVVWLIVDNFFNFTRDMSEWTGTEVRFEISRVNGRTEIRFTHVGLVPAYECFDICSNAWTGYINGSLRSLIESGEGRPNDNEEGLVRGEEQRQRLGIAG